MYSWHSRQCERRIWLDVHGDGEARNPAHPPLSREVREAAVAALADLALSAEPPIWLADFCPTCPWYRHCKDRAVETGAVTLLPGLHHASWLHMQRIGMHTLEQVADAPPELLRRIPKIGAKTAQKLQFAARALIDRQPVWRQSLEATARLPGLWLDIETEWEIDKPWSFGWIDTDDRRNILVVGRGEGELDLASDVRVTLVGSGIAAWEVIEAAADGAPIYHWGGYDRAVMRATAAPDVRMRLDDRMIDLNAVLRRTVTLPLPNTSMKTVAPYLGCFYPEVADAMTAWKLYQRWQRSSDSDALARACAYLRADVEGLARVWRWMVENSP